MLIENFKKYYGEFIKVTRDEEIPNGTYIIIDSENESVFLYDIAKDEILTLDITSILCDILYINKYDRIDLIIEGNMKLSQELEDFDIDKLNTVLTNIEILCSIKENI